MLSGVFGLLGSDYGKFRICRKSWRQITTKDKVYNECVKQIFHFNEDSEETIKKNISKSMRKSWKETRLRLYDRFYDPTFMTEQNLENCLPGIDREHWRLFLDYRVEPETKEKCRKNAENRSKQQYTHAGGSKSFAWRMEEEVFRKEKPGRVHGVGFGPTHSQLFGPNSHAPGNGVQLEETQRKLLELQAELDGEKLKRKAMEDEAVAEKKKMKAMESALIYLF
ncbi:uncharacterized protein LOC130933517 [Arachis stenosperma]|uniref:uncharacterized protein LOC130933517 n=1 Tax=Arachis stenosperma TaxID=217475 RepID=UPI0025AC96FA|nr:uncharacterized protein LOC130933517 [Arachis stenosperma]